MILKEENIKNFENKSKLFRKIQISTLKKSEKFEISMREHLEIVKTERKTEFRVQSRNDSIENLNKINFRKKRKKLGNMGEFETATRSN